MSNLKLRAETTEPEKRVVMEERRLRSVDNPWGALYEETNAAAFRAHPYMWPVIGWMHDIESATLDDIRGHYETYYKPNNAIVVIVGNVDPDRALEQVRNAFGANRSGPPLLQRAGSRAAAGRRAARDRQEGSQPPRVVLGLQGAEREKPGQCRARGAVDGPFGR